MSALRENAAEAAIPGALRQAFDPEAGLNLVDPGLMHRGRTPSAMPALRDRRDLTGLRRWAHSFAIKSGPWLGKPRPPMCPSM